MGSVVPVNGDKAVVIGGETTVTGRVEAVKGGVEVATGIVAVASQGMAPGVLVIVIDGGAVTVGSTVASLTPTHVIMEVGGDTSNRATRADRTTDHGVAAVVMNCLMQYSHW